MTTKSNHMKAQCFASGNICTYSTLSFHKYILVNSTLAMGITVLRTVMTTNYPRKTASAPAQISAERAIAKGIVTIQDSAMFRINEKSDDDNEDDDDDDSTSGDYDDLMFW